MRISDWSSDVCSSDLGRTADPLRRDDDLSLWSQDYRAGSCRKSRLFPSWFRHFRRPRAEGPRSQSGPRAESMQPGQPPSPATRQYNRPAPASPPCAHRSEEHTSELQSLMRISYAVFCLTKKKITKDKPPTTR